MKQRRQRHFWPVLAVLTGAVGVMTLLPGTRQSASIQQLSPAAILAPCATTDSRYAELFFQSLPLVADWPEEYHRIVNTIVEEYLQPPEEVTCDADTVLPVHSADTLFDIASKLPPWSTPETQQTLSPDDVGAVLLEFLRVYECGLSEQKDFRDKFAGEQEGDTDTAREHLTHGNVNEVAETNRKIIERELLTARPTLERTLQMLAGTTRLSRLDAELQCMQRASLDIRNALSLAAETSACLPRIWNARDPLRDIAQ